ncbi:3-oxoacyl-ACP reductase FabG [Streptomyces viridosporus]|uniref:SDR family oxidoreductase n=2 Tax=Streptomyces viridosporus TaxID=67581 RepID=A0ABX6A7I6_STRVD|nr:3-oxoacyl-ACP reductase FabG [Streptomyces viridosporus]EFE71847.1 3-oxoacyl-[acyl-carrier-protein] reductase [Streptomyces viridosporus ATCC 14672]QEU83712.1 SDR family oxidoreductase [Streptomyces viridosporus T7A]
MGRSVMVTGGNRGIGLAVARALAADGDRVAVTHRDTGPPDKLFAVRAEMTDTKSIDTAFEKVEAEHGPVEVLVVNAGITRDTLFLRMDERDFTDVVDVNLHGAFRTVRRAVRGMVRARWGRIVLMSSMTYAYGAPGQVNYGAAKAGMLGMARSLAWELGPRNITVNVVAPGLIDTDMSREITDRRREHLLTITPLGRMGEVEDVAAAVRYLTGESGRFVTGAVLPVSGGLGLGG